MDDPLSEFSVERVQSKVGKQNKARPSYCHHRKKQNSSIKSASTIWESALNFVGLVPLGHCGAGWT